MKKVSQSESLTYKLEFKKSALKEWQKFGATLLQFHIENRMKFRLRLSILASGFGPLNRKRNTVCQLILFIASGLSKIF